MFITTHSRGNSRTRVDQALMDTLEELEAGPGDPATDANSGNTAGQAADPRATKDYSSLPMGYLSTCAQDHGEDSSPYFDCLDAGVESEAINLRVENEFSDITPEEIDGCTTYGNGSDDFFTCLFAVRDNKASQGQAVDTSGDTSGQPDQGQTDQQLLDQAIVDFPDLTGEEVESCTPYGLGTDDFSNCLYAVRENKAAQDASAPAPAEQQQDGQQETAEQANPDGAGQQQVLAEVSNYCSTSYQGEQAGQCGAVLADCVYGYTDYNSAEFNQCIEGSGW